VLGVNIKGVVVSAKHVNCIFGSSFLDLERVLFLMPCGSGSTDFEGSRVSPTVDFPAKSKCVGGVGSTDDLLDLSLSGAIKDFLHDLNGTLSLVQLHSFVGLQVRIEIRTGGLHCPDTYSVAAPVEDFVGLLVEGD
jgi:hypothetical protein